jgi:hypothetical protein
MAAARTVSIRLTDHEIAKLDEMRGLGMSRSGYVRELLRRGGPVDEPPTHLEAMTLLAARARGGSTAAVIALERATRDHKDRDTMDWILQADG